MSIIIDALKAKYVAERLQAVANLQIYLSSAVGVGEHPNIVDECDKLVDKIESAEGKLKTLHTLIEQSVEQTSIEE
tara:strand:- start:204 stop:431 length:228 start_codon:yes stop_codon:yes gene_type:complete